MQRLHAGKDQAAIAMAAPVTAGWIASVAPGLRLLDLHVGAANPHAAFAAERGAMAGRQAARGSPTPQFLAVSFVFALQEIKKVKDRALRAISAVFSSALASEIW